MPLYIYIYKKKNRSESSIFVYFSHFYSCLSHLDLVDLFSTTFFYKGVEIYRKVNKASLPTA